MLNCQKATQLFSESQERPLTLKEKMDLKLHTLEPISKLLSVRA